MSDRLDTLAKIHYGKSPNDVISADGNVPIVGTGGIYGLANTAMFESGIVVARKGSLGTPHLFKKPFWPADTTYTVAPCGDVDIDWLYYTLLNFDLTKLNEATGVPSINRNWLAKVTFPNPGSQRQKKIATILTTIDIAIEKTEALIAKYQQIKAGLMHDLFTRGVLPDGQLRPPRSEAPELYQETEIGWIPIEWEVTSLRTCLTNSPTNGIYKSADQIGEEGVLMVGQTAFTADRSVDFSLCRRGNVSFEDIRRYGLSMGDVLVTRVFATVQGVGLPTLVPKLPEPAVFESNMMRLQVNSLHILPEFLFEWLRFPIARKYVYAGANASNQCSVNQGVLNPMPIPRPDEKEQERLVARIQHLDKYIFSERDSLENLKSQKRGLMQDLLTGKVPVQVNERNTEVTA